MEAFIVVLLHLCCRLIEIALKGRALVEGIRYCHATCLVDVLFSVAAAYC